MGDHADLYMLAFLEGDKAAMQHEADWAKGKPDEFVMLETVAEATAASGQDAEGEGDLPAGGGQCAAGEAPGKCGGHHGPPGADEAEVGNTAQARERVQAALAIDRSRFALPFAGFALATAGDVAQATAIADELSQAISDGHSRQQRLAAVDPRRRSSSAGAIPAKRSSCSSQPFRTSLAGPRG